MDQKYKDFEKTSKKKVSFNFTPNYKEQVEIPGVSPRLIIEIAQKAVEALDWTLIYVDEAILEAHTSSGKWSANYAVSISINHLGRMEVKSQSTGNEIIDLGANSKKVKLFIYAFEDIRSGYDQTALNELQKQVEREDKMSDYVLPESLPQPKTSKIPNRNLLWAGALAFSAVAAFLLAFISYHGIYIIGLFEFAVAWLAALTIKQVLKWSNYTDLTHYTLLIITMTAVIFIGEQLFQYLIFINDTGYSFLSFFDFMEEKIAAGVKIKESNVGSIGLIISWVIEIALLYFLMRLQILQKIILYMVERVQPEVLEFARYHFAQGKTEDEVKAELSKMGWHTDAHHQMVWDAFGGISGIQEMRRN